MQADKIKKKKNWQLYFSAPGQRKTEWKKAKMSARNKKKKNWKITEKGGKEKHDDNFYTILVCIQENEP